VFSSAPQEKMSQRKHNGKLAHLRHSARVQEGWLARVAIIAADRQF
jgi:hypothetical protein